MENIQKIINSFSGIDTTPETIIKEIKCDIAAHRTGIDKLFNFETNNNFIKNDEINRVLDVFFYYFTGNKTECEKRGIDLDKSIFLSGGVGCGKTLFFTVFKKYTTAILRKNGFQMFSNGIIIDDLNIYGASEFNKFYLNRQGDRDYPITAYIDDIFHRNAIIKNYGTEINVIQQLIEYRYIIYTKFKKLTHFSSNIHPVDFPSVIDLRTADRLHEICNFVEFKGDSFRR